MRVYIVNYCLLYTSQDEDAAPYGDVLPVVGTELGGWDATGEKSGLLLKLANLYAVLETLRLKTAEGEKLTRCV